VSAGALFIVDDNPHNLGLLAGILREAGYEVRSAQSARRALPALRTQTPELLLLDINMPDMNGIELCRALKAEPGTADLPVIFLSALDDVADKVSAFDAGGVDYVTKPFQREEVLARVATQLRLARLRRALEDKNLELARKNEQLEQAWRRTDQVFTALSDVLPGMVLGGRYRLEEKIGIGGFAAIYRARHLELDRPVAVKVLRPDGGSDPEAYLARFRNEGLSATRVNHPNAVAVLDSGVTPAGVAYLVMELLTGRSLSDHIANRTLSPRRCLEIMEPVCDALAHAHAQGILHRDVKPANIFLHDGGAGEVVKVVDFGIAKLVGDEATDHTTIGRLIGTPVYMSPERLLGKPHDARADTYGVGVTLYQMIARRLPFELEDRSLGSVILTCISEPPTPLRRHAPEASPAIEAVVMRALAKQPEDRPTVSEVARDLREAVEADAGPDRPLGDTVEITR
jgi:CheY-like chemotaxis protein